MANAKYKVTAQLLKIYNNINLLFSPILKCIIESDFMARFGFTCIPSQVK